MLAVCCWILSRCVLCRRVGGLQELKCGRVPRINVPRGPHVVHLEWEGREWEIRTWSPPICLCVMQMSIIRTHPLLEEAVDSEFKVLFRCLVRIRVLLNVVVVAAWHLQMHRILDEFQRQLPGIRIHILRHRSLAMSSEAGVAIESASSCN